MREVIKVRFTWWQVELVRNRSVVEPHLGPIVPSSKRNCSQVSHEDERFAIQRVEIDGMGWIT